ncbi:hypothetical protein HOO14_00410 [bacterium]|jgi:RNA polymerase sigma factor (sigma-70 family)|nr:hypothetical protein [bacterium]
MSIKRPFIRFAIDKIEFLFKKGKNNKILTQKIKNELEYRKTKKSKKLKDEVSAITSNNLKKEEKNDKALKFKQDDASKAVLIKEATREISNEKESEILHKVKESQSLDDFLKTVTLKEYVRNNNVPVRVKNSILAVDEVFIGFDSIYSFITASKKNKAGLIRRLEFFGEKSLNHLVKSIEEYIKGLNLGSLDSFNKVLESRSVFASPIVDKELEDSLNAKQIEALKNIPLNFFVSSCDQVSIRTRNAILKADGLYEYQNLYDFYVSPDRYKENLLYLDDFGRLSLDNLINSVKFIINEEKLLTRLSNTVTKTRNINTYETIEEFVNYAIISILSDKERLIIKERYLNENTLTLEEVGSKQNVSRERIRQVESKAIQKIQGFDLCSSAEESHIKFQIEFENYFFENCDFISIKRAESIVKKMHKSVALYVKIFANSLSELLNKDFFYSSKFQGWFASEAILNETENSFILQACFDIDLDLAIQNAQWPITISNLSDIMDLPEGVVTDMVILSTKLNIEGLQNGDFVRPVKVTVKNAVRYVLRRYKKGMTLEEVKNNCLEMFNLKLTVRAIGSALGDLPDGLIVDTGTYALYEYLEITNKQLNNIREFGKKYLLKEQEYISAFVIFNNLKKQNNIFEKYGALDNGHIFFGVCQDNESFITKKGFMLGLKTSNFEGEYISLTKEIVNLMNQERRPLSAREIIDKLSATRFLTHSSIQGIIERDIFEKIGDSFYLSGDQSHLEINDEELLEHEFDDI